ncbi:hypothetical protein Tsubulata_018529 [Turnera subulata]|uniref:Uncharacterized protein n=1 Tax=Turnera subulata TaxID=218843 RepID=A0A9Q0JQC1_9ROSI|nr:hypothetical protein Tsubulata_018529 [Turnera subulata]
MDMKGITWIGNFYQKFEAMCLEVEEIMYEDTVKYVENQMQTVGDSVKRFYSDVMEDFLPPSPMDPEKGAFSYLAVEPYADIGHSSKPKPKIGKKVREIKVVDITVDKKVKDIKVVDTTEDPKMTSDNNTTSPTFQVPQDGDYLSPVFQGDSAGGARRRHIKQNLADKSNESSSKTSRVEKLSMFIAPSDSNEASIAPSDANEEKLSFVIAPSDANEEKLSFVIASSDPDLVRGSSTCELSKEASLLSETTLGPVEVSGEDNIEGSKTEIGGGTEDKRNMLDYVPYSDSETLLESGWRKGNSVQIPPCTTDSDKSKVLLDDGSKNLEGVTSTKQELEIIQQVDEKKLEDSQQVDEKKLEETCVVVTGDGFQPVPHDEVKHRAIKNIIRKVLPSRKNSVRKEYEKLAAQYGDDSKPDEQEEFASANEASRSPAHDSGESDWELV